MIPLILAGGKGERLWPLSCRKNPKQFLSLDRSGKSLLQKTANRLLPIVKNWEDLWVITVECFAKKVLEQLPDLPKYNLLVQSKDCDTAPAITWGTLEIRKRYGDNVVIGSFPTDHWIDNEQIFQKTLQVAELIANDSMIVTLGISPTYPSVNYGYIEQGSQISNFNSIPVYKIERFFEKPEYFTAKSFQESGKFTWNSGILIFKASTMVTELYTYLPEIIHPLEKQSCFICSNIPKQSIYYDLMEKTKNACVLPISFNWDDLGDWNVLERLFKGNKSNTELANHIGIDTQETILYSNNEQDLIVTIGLRNMIIIRAGKITLIMDKKCSQEIKQILEILKNDPKLKDYL